MRARRAERKSTEARAGITKEVLVCRSRAYWMVGSEVVRLYTAIKERADLPTEGPQVWELVREGAQRAGVEREILVYGGMGIEDGFEGGRVKEGELTGVGEADAGSFEVSDVYVIHAWRICCAAY
jgi:hypothetical protein